MEEQLLQSGLCRLSVHKMHLVVISRFLGYLLTWVTEGEGAGHEAPVTEGKPTIYSSHQWSLPSPCPPEAGRSYRDSSAQRHMAVPL